MNMKRPAGKLKRKRAPKKTAKKQDTPIDLAEEEMLAFEIPALCWLCGLD